MKRSGFEQKLTKPLKRSSLKRAAMKKKSSKQTKLTKSAKGQSCTFNVADVCSYDNETVVLCHLDSEFKGMALKSPDHFAAYGCFHCHSWLDQHKGSEVDRLYYSLRALCRTHDIMIDEGLMVLK